MNFNEMEETSYLTVKSIIDAFIKKGKLPIVH